MFEIFVDDYKAPYNAIPIGHQGENEARCLIWNLAPYIQEFGDDGVVQVKVTQPETKYVYFATNVAKVGNLAIWTVTNVDTAKHGTGMCELYYNAPDGTTLAKSDVYKIWIFPTQGEAGDAPSPYEDLLEKVGEYAADAEASSNSAAGYADAAAQSATEAGAAAQSAVEESVAELQAELDQAISGATVDSEVINARVDADGTTYSTLKARLDAENANLKNQLDEIEPIVFDKIVSTNVFTPKSTRVYPQDGSCTIGEDNIITISNVTGQHSVWIFAQDGDNQITLEAGDYTLCIDPGLWGPSDILITLQKSTGTYTNIVTVTGDRTQFTLENDVTAKFRVAYYNSDHSFVTNWSGHIWINKGEAQDYMPVGGSESTPKSFVNEKQGAENAGKILGIDEDGDVYPKEDKSETAVQKELYQYGNLLDYDEVNPGYIGSNGQVVSYSTLWCSGFIPVKPGKVYCSVTGVHGGTNYSNYFAFYDENKDFVESYSTIGAMTRYTPVIYFTDVPEGAKFFRCTFSNNQKTTKSAWISNKPEFPQENDLYNVENVFPYVMNPKNPCDYSELTIRAFSKVVCIGDSLTYGGFNMDDNSGTSGQTQSNAELSLRYSYPSNFQRITGIETVNKGTSGETTVSWYQNHQNDDFTSFDLAIIHLGVNDSAFNVSDTDTLTAMQNIVTMLNEARSDMRIAICSVIPAYNVEGYQRKGQLILNWAKELNNPNIIPINIAQYSHVQAETSYVAGHLSALGYYMMALDIARYISWYMDNNKRDFRFIQFIGSPNASYSGD